MRALITPGVRPSFSDFHVHPNSTYANEAALALKKAEDEPVNEKEKMERHTPEAV